MQSPQLHIKPNSHAEEVISLPKLSVVGSVEKERKKDHGAYSYPALDVRGGTNIQTPTYVYSNNFCVLKPAEQMCPLLENSES